MTATKLFGYVFTSNISFFRTDLILLLHNTFISIDLFFVDSWMKHFEKQQMKPEPYKNPLCTTGCGFTASWGLTGGVPGCQGNRDYCFSCFKTQHSNIQVIEAQLKNDLHLSSAFGPTHCAPCHAMQEINGTGQHFADPTSRSTAWKPATCCLEHLIGFNEAHNKNGGNVKGTFTEALELLQDDHPLIIEARELVIKLRKTQENNGELDICTLFTR